MWCKVCVYMCVYMCVSLCVCVYGKVYDFSLFLLFILLQMSPFPPPLTTSPQPLTPLCSGHHQTIV